MGQVSFVFGGKNAPKRTLNVSDSMVIVGRPLSAARRDLKPAAKDITKDMKLHTRFAMGFEVREVTDGVVPTLRSLKKNSDTLKFAGHVLTDPETGAPVAYTERVFVKFVDSAKISEIREILNKHRASKVRFLPFARNAVLFDTRRELGRDVFDLAQQILRAKAVSHCHPELLRERALKEPGIFPSQWHLGKRTISGVKVDAHAHVEEAWKTSEGANTTIAVIDTGIDIDHVEFNGGSKIVAPYSVTDGVVDPRPKGAGENHGTACAGVACAGGSHGATGVAPAARLLPIRSMSDLGSESEADAFYWAAKHGADVISCSWGPEDGNPTDPTDPLHKAENPLPDLTRFALEAAVKDGRMGRGCVITWAAGNGNESVDNDGYASYADVIAVAACNDRGLRSGYSDFGRAVSCAFPSNDLAGLAQTSGIWTTDRSGKQGYNSGSLEKGDKDGHYTNSFGGTSSACPGVAGVAALMIAANPNLSAREIKTLLQNTADKIDKSGGKYNTKGHSPYYGYGRINAAAAVKAALE